MLSWILENFFQIVIHLTQEVIPIPKTFVVAYRRWKNEINSKKNYIVRMHQEDHIETGCGREEQIQRKKEIQDSTLVIL
jgi:hypothetical protein